MNKAEFFQGIDWEAPLSRDLITQLYGYSMYDKQFLVDVLAEYEKHGRAGVKYIFRLYVNLEERHRRRELIPISRELIAQTNAKYERKVKEYEWKKKIHLQSLSEEELERMLKSARR